MKTRCLNPNADNWKYYGCKGIKVCERWLKFENFLEDMGKRPKGKTIDRIDSNKNYKPSNCRWVDSGKQSRNRKYVINKKVRNEIKKLLSIGILDKDIAKKFNISESSVSNIRRESVS